MDAEQPEWLRLYALRSPAVEVVKAWLNALGTEERANAERDAPAARTALRCAIVDCRDSCSAVRADAEAGWKYTGSIIRAMDAALGVGPCKPSGVFGPKGEDLHAPRQIVRWEGPGTMGIFWSGVQGAGRADLMLALGITHRLNVAAECVRTLPDCDAIVTKTVPILDLQHEQLDQDTAAFLIWPEQLRESIQILRDWRAEAATKGAIINVNISCQMGKNRSGAVIAAWLCLEHNWELLAAVDHLRQVSSLSLGNPHLNVALAHVLGQDEIDIPLNPAHDGGSWVTFSPPGSPVASRPPVASSPLKQGGEPNCGLVLDTTTQEEESAQTEELGGLADLVDLLEGI